ncbi:MAG: hypothetical protein MI725_09080 [Pirellulales bacterium]|nr:hypothetical protein [Pirellulales bacterium]
MRTEPGYLPTPQQIAAACLYIRQQWSPAEHQRRLVGQSCAPEHAGWSPPRIDTSMCTTRVRKAVSDMTS